MQGVLIAARALQQVNQQALGSRSSAAQMTADAQTRWQNARGAYQDGLVVLILEAASLHLRHVPRDVGVPDLGPPVWRIVRRSA